MMKYLGNGFLIGVPARDLTKAEVEALGVDPDKLVESGLYGKEVGRVKKVTEEAQNDGATSHEVATQLMNLDGSQLRRQRTEDGQGMSSPSEIDELEITN